MIQIRLKVHRDEDAIGDKKQVLKMHILMKSHVIIILNLKEILLDLVTISQFRKEKAVSSSLELKKKINNQTIILILSKKWTIH